MHFRVTVLLDNAVSFRQLRWSYTWSYSGYLIHCSHPEDVRHCAGAQAEPASEAERLDTRTSQFM